MAISASVVFFTSAARRRVSSPSAACGRRSCRASATTRPSTASPMNSSRSLFAAPALRWVSAACSSSTEPNSWASARLRRDSGSLSRGGDLDTLVERHDEPDVRDERGAMVVLRAHHVAGALALDLDVAGLEDVHVARIEVLRERLAQVAHGRRLAVERVLH